MKRIIEIRVAICNNEKICNHSISWVNPWVKYCEDNNITYDLVDCYQPDIIDRLKHYDCLLWHFQNYIYQDMMMARSILYSAENMGISVFPDFKCGWHFDDKIAETYLLESINAPIPKSVIYYSLDDCINWINSTNVDFPLIAKLRCGSGSHNVKILKNKRELLKYARKMFGSGIKAAPSLIFKASSNLKSSTNWETVIKRIKRLPEFLRTLKNAKIFPREKQYVFFQEFIPNDGYDLKVVVVGDKLSFVGRNIRKGDFRASGGGDLFVDRKKVPRNVIDSAFAISDKLGFQCMGYDYVVNNITEEGIIIEMSYGFSHLAQLQVGGYFDRNGNWHDEPLNAPFEILENILKKKSNFN